MRVAVLSDIHSNYAALVSVLRDAETQSIDGYWLLGDLFGYGPDALMCFDLWLTFWHDTAYASNSAWILGNHDAGLIGRLPLLGAFTSDAAWVLRYERSLLDEQGRWAEVLEMLGALPLGAEAPKTGVWLMHGRTWPNPDVPAGIDIDKSLIDYIGWEGGRIVADGQEHGYKVERVFGWRRQQEQPPRLILGGHSHIPLFWKRRQGWGQYASAWEPAADLQQGKLVWSSCPRCKGNVDACQGIGVPGELPLPPEAPVFINPGSVGQPRDGCPAAAYAVLDFDNETVVFRRVPYRVQDTQKTMQLFGFPNKLIERLSWGQ